MVEVCQPFRNRRAQNPTILGDVVGTIAVSSDDTSNIVWEPSFNRSPFYTKDRGLTWERVVFPGEQLPDTGSHSRYTFARKTWRQIASRPAFSIWSTVAKVRTPN